MCVHVGHVRGEHRSGRHHVPIDVAAAAQRGPANIGDVGDDGLQVLLQHAVELERLARRGAQIALPVGVGHRVQLPVELWRHLAVGHLEAEHELVGLGPLRAPRLAVLLLVGAVMLEDDDGVLANGDLLGGHVVLERLQKLVLRRGPGVELHVFHAVELLQVRVGLGCWSARGLRTVLLAWRHPLGSRVWFRRDHAHGAADHTRRGRGPVPLHHADQRQMDREHQCSRCRRHSLFEFLVRRGSSQSASDPSSLTFLLAHPLLRCP